MKSTYIATIIGEKGNEVKELATLMAKITGKPVKVSIEESGIKHVHILFDSNGLVSFEKINQEAGMKYLSKEKEPIVIGP